MLVKNLKTSTAPTCTTSHLGFSDPSSPASYTSEKTLLFSSQEVWDAEVKKTQRQHEALAVAPPTPMAPTTPKVPPASWSWLGGKSGGDGSSRLSTFAVDVNMSFLSKPAGG